MLMAKIMCLRNEDVGLVARHVSLNESDPAIITPNIAAKPAPPSKELSDNTLAGKDTEFVN